MQMIPPTTTLAATIPLPYRPGPFFARPAMPESLFDASVHIVRIVLISVQLREESCLRLAAFASSGASRAQYPFRFSPALQRLPHTLHGSCLIRGLGSDLSMTYKTSSYLRMVLTSLPRYLLAWRWERNARRGFDIISAYDLSHGRPRNSPSGACLPHQAQFFLITNVIY